MSDLERILLARADEQMRVRGLPAGGPDSWDVVNAPKVSRRVSWKGKNCACGAPVEKRGRCHRCYLRARRAGDL